MWMVVGSALAARRGQATVTGLVALLASAALAATPGYVAVAAEDVEEAAVAGTPIADRVITISHRLAGDDTGDPDPLPPVRSSFAPPGFVTMSGGFATAETDPAVWGEELPVVLAHREGVCEALLIAGECPTAADEVLLPAGPAASAGLAAGDDVTVAQSRDDLHTLRVVGTYEVRNAADPYWGDNTLIGSRADVGALTVFTVADTLLDYARVTYTYELVATPQAFEGAAAEQIWRDLTAQLAEVQRQRFVVDTSEVAALVERIERDRGNLVAGVGVAVAILLLFTWFTLAVALRGMVVELRADLGWWRLRGVPAGRGFAALFGQGAVPLLAGALIGTAVGLLIASWLGARDADDGGGATTLALALVGLAVGGGLVTVLTTQLGMLRAPVRDLIRRVPARRARWRRSVVDLVLVLLSAAAVAQALTVGREARGLALLAPALAALGIALVAAWALPPVAASLGVRALRAGRLAGALVAMSATRRSGTHRMFAVLVVAVALVTTAVVGWTGDGRAQWERAALESGADRVIRVAPVAPARLLATVRSVDPTGAHAMAVVRRPAVSGQPAVLAVDTPRLGVVVAWRSEYGGTPREVATALRPVEPAPVTVSTDRISVTATGADPTGAEVYLRLHWYTVDTGEPVAVTVGPLREQPGEHSADLAACRAGCRLVGFDVIGPKVDAESSHERPDVRVPPASGTEVELRALADGEGRPVAPEVVTDPTRWRPSFGANDRGPQLTVGDHGLRLTLRTPREGIPLLRVDRVYLADTPAPLPVVSAGWRPEPIEERRLIPLSGDPVPVHQALTAPLLPGARAGGVLVDLEYAQRLQPEATALSGGEVWLSASAPAAIVDELRQAGLLPLGEESLSDRQADLAAEGRAVATRFRAVVAVICLVLAAGVVMVLSAQEQAGRAAELAALRVQGLRVTAVRAIGYGAVLSVVGAAAVVGLAAGLVGAVLGRALHPGFVDGWELLPFPSPPAHPVVGAFVGAVAVLGAAGVVAAALLLRRARRLP